MFCSCSHPKPCGCPSRPIRHGLRTRSRQSPANDQGVQIVRSAPVTHNDDRQAGMVPEDTPSLRNCVSWRSRRCRARNNAQTRVCLRDPTIHRTVSTHCQKTPKYVASGYIFATCAAAYIFAAELQAPTQRALALFRVSSVRVLHASGLRCAPFVCSHKQVCGRVHLVDHSCLANAWPASH